MTPAVQPASTRDRIHSVAVELFFYQGYGGTSLREIADLSQINVATVYHHYRSKQALLEEICLGVLNQALALAENALAHSTDPIERLRALVVGHIVFHCKHAREAGITDREINSLPVNVRVELVRLRDSYENVWETVIRDGAEGGDFDIDDLQVFRIAALTMCSQVANWYDPEGRLSTDEVAARYAAMVLRMAGCAV